MKLITCEKPRFVQGYWKSAKQASLVTMATIRSDYGQSDLLARFDDLANRLVIDERPAIPCGGIHAADENPVLRV